MTTRPGGAEHWGDGGGGVEGSRGDISVTLLSSFSSLGLQMRRNALVSVFYFAEIPFELPPQATGTKLADTLKVFLSIYMCVVVQRT